MEGVNIYDMLKANEVLFERFGGHKAACGFTMKEEHLETLRENLNRQMNALIAENPTLLDESLKADMVLEAVLTGTVFEELEKKYFV